MSKTIDEKVVSMKFDNSNFEKNVSTSMSTLDKLKNSLKFDNATKGFDSISKAAGKCDVSPLAAGVETVKVKFSALEVVAVTALANITNSAINAGKQLVSSLSVDQIAAGWDKYAQKTASVQTIMNSTGKSIDEVNQYLNKLMWFSDETSYGFTDMTSALATMTSSGGDIEKLIPMIEGVANATAFAGKGAAEFSRIMQFAVNQAYSTGYMQIQDWKSIEGATVNSKQLQESLIAAGEALGKFNKGAVTLENFRSSLKDKWLDQDVMEQGFGVFSKVTEAAYDIINDETNAVDNATTAYKVLSGELGKTSSEYLSLSDKQKALVGAFSDVEIAAAKSAQEAKTFAEAIDATKDAVSSGWMKTFELIFGNYDKAKVLWTDLANNLWDVFASGGETRNTILTDAMSSSWDKIIAKIEEAGGTSMGFQDKLSGVLQANGFIIDDVIDKYGSLEKAFTSGGISSEYLEKAIDSLGGSFGELDKVQSGLNFGKTGDEVKIAQKALKDLGYDLGKFGEQADGIDGIFGKVTRSAVEAFQAANNLNKTGIIDDATLASLKEASGATEKISVDCKDLVANITQLGGRENIVAAINNAFEGLTKTLATVKEAWNNIFYHGKSDEAILKIKAQRILRLTEVIRNFTEKLNFSDETAEKLRRTFEGLFAILDIIRTVVGGALRVVFEAIKEVLKEMDINVLDVTASIGDWLVKIRDWIKQNNFLVNSLKTVITFFIDAYKYVKKWIQAFLEIPEVQQAISNFGQTISNVFSSVKDWFANVFKSIATFLGMAKDVDSITMEGVREQLKNFKDGVVKWFSEIDFSFDGIKNGFEKLKDGVVKALEDLGVNFDAIKIKFSEIVAYIREKIPAAISIGLGVLMIRSVSKLSDALNAFAGPLGDVTKVLNSFAGAITNIGKSLASYNRAQAFKAAAAGIKEIAIAVLVLVGAIAVLTQLDDEKVKLAMARLAIIAGGLAFFAAAMAKIGSTEAAISGSFILKIGAAVLALAWVMNIISGLTSADIEKGISVLFAFSVFVAALIAVSYTAGKYASQAGTMAIKMGVAMMLFCATLTMIGKMDDKELIKGIAVLGVFGIFISALIAVSSLAGEHASKAGSMALKIGVALLAWVAVIAIAGSMDPSQVMKGVLAVGAMSGIIIGMIAISSLAGKYSSKAGGMILGIGLGLLGLIGVVKIASGLTQEEINKGIDTITGLSYIVAGLIAVSRLAGKYSARGGIMILAISGSLLVMTGVIYLLKDIDKESLFKAVAAIDALCIVFAALIAASHLAQECKAMIVVLTVVVGLLGGLLILLSSDDFDQTKMVIASASLSVLIGMFAILSLAMKSLAKVDAKGAIGKIGALLIVVAGLAGVLGIMSMFPQSSSAIENAEALSILIIALSGVVVLLNKTNVSFTRKAWSVAIALGILVAALAGIAATLTIIKDVENATDKAEALAILIGVLSLCVTAFGLIGSLGGVWGIAGMAAGALSLGIAIGFMGIVVNQLTAMDGLKNAKENAEALATVITAIGEALFALSIVSPLLVVADVALAGFGLVISGFIALAIQLGKLMEHNKDIEKFLNTGVDTLIKMADGLGRIIGAFVGGIADQFSKVLPDIGTNLSLFMTNIQGFVDGAATIGTNSTFSQGVDHLVAAIVKLCASDIIYGAARFIGTDLDTFGTKLSDFATNVGGFITAVTGIKPESAAGMEAFASLVLKISQGSFLQSISTLVGAFTGVQGLDTLGVKLSSFGTSMKTFLESISDLTTEDLTKVDIASGAASKMVDLENSLRGLNGFVQLIAGQQDLGTFGAHMELFGACLVSYAKSVDGITPEMVESVKESAVLGSAMAELQSSITATSGLGPALDGFKDLSVFGTQMQSFGASLVAYGRAVSGITSDDVTSIQNSAMAAAALAEVANALPAIGGLTGLWEGDQDLDAFGKGLASLGAGVKAFAESARGIEPGDVEAIQNTKAVIEAMKDVTSVITGGGGGFLGLGAVTDLMNNESILAWSTAILNMARGIRSYIALAHDIDDEDITAITKSKEAINALKEVMDAIPNAYNDKADNADKFTTAMLTAITNTLSCITTASGITSTAPLYNYQIAVRNLKESADLLDGCTSAYTFEGKINAFTRAATQLSTASCLNFSGLEDFKAAITSLAELDIEGFNSKLDGITTAVTNIVTTMATAITNATQTVTTAFTSLLDSCIATIVTKESDFLTEGTVLAGNIQNGISSGMTTVSDTVTNALEICLSTITSYNESFNTAGKNVTSGFANGIDENSYLATNAAARMASKVLETIKTVTDQASPSKATEKMGVYIDEGFANGMDEATPVATSSASRMANGVIGTIVGVAAPLITNGIGSGVVNNIANGLTGQTPAATDAAGGTGISIIERFKNELGWDKSTAVGSNFVQGVATGIKKNTSAEKAAKEKADAINDAFESEIQKRQLAQQLVEAEKSLWEVQNPDPKKNDQDKIDRDTLKANIDAQKEIISVRQSQWEFAKKTYGEMSEEAIKAQIEMTKAQTQYHTWLNELNGVGEKTKNSSEEMISAVTDFHYAAKAYGDDMAANKDTLLRLGFTLDEIEAAARQKSGYNVAPKATEETEKAGKEATNSVVKQLGTVEEICAQAVDDTTAKVAKSATGIGNAYTQNIATSLQNGTPNMLSTFSNTMTSIVLNLETYIPIFEKVGLLLDQGLADGIAGGAPGVCDVAEAMGRAVLGRLYGVLGIASPSKEFYAIGDFCDQGLVNALNDGASDAEKAGANLATASLRGISNAMSGVSAVVSSGLDSAPVITPVIDMANIRATGLNVSSDLTASLAQPVDNLSKIMASTQANIEASNQKVVDAIDGLRADLNAFADKDGEVALYVDSKKLVSTIAKPMNRQLSVLSKRGAY